MTDNPFITDNAPQADGDNPFLSGQPEDSGQGGRFATDVVGGFLHSGAGSAALAARQGIIDNGPAPRITPDANDPDAIAAARMQRANRPKPEVEAQQFQAIKDQQDATKMALAQYEAMRPAQGTEMLPAVAGHLLGGFASPESWITDVPGISGMISNVLKAGWLARTTSAAASQAVIQSIADPITQSARVSAGVQPGIDPTELAMAPLQGAALGVIAHNLLHELPLALRGAAAPEGAAKPAEKPQEAHAAQPAPETPAKPAEASAPSAGEPAPVETPSVPAVVAAEAKGEPVQAASTAKEPLIGPEASGVQPHTVTTASGRSVDVAPVVVDAANLRTSDMPEYDASLQPRDRGRAASQAQILDIATRLDPARLGFSAEADRGAPIVGPDSMIESGNGRVMAIRRAYEQGGEAAAKYRDWVSSQGVDVSGMKEPILVRQRVTPLSPEDRKAFTVEANQSATLSMSASERALADSRNLRPETLDLIRNPDDLGAVANRDFVRSFVQSLPQSEQGMMATADGGLTSEGLGRIRNAVLARAYGDAGLMARISEATTDEIKSISNALTSAAPDWAKLRGDVDSGLTRADMDLTPELVEAVRRTADLRAKGEKLDTFLAQQDAFDQLPKSVESWMRMFYDGKGRRAASQQLIAERLKAYAREARKVSGDEGLGLGLPEVRPEDIQALAAKRGADDAAQNDLFKSGGARDGASDAGGGGRGRGLVEDRREPRSASDAGDQGGEQQPLAEQPLRGGKQPRGSNAADRRFSVRDELPGEALNKTGPNVAITDEEARNHNLNAAMRDIATRMGRRLETDGRISIGGALGTYKPKEGVLRIRHVGDTEVFAHELGHAVDQFLANDDVTKPDWAALKKANPSELTAMDLNAIRTGSKPSIAEGVAEFIRSYIANPAWAYKQAPLTFDAFQKVLAKQPELKSILADAANLSRVESGLNPKQVMETMIADKPQKGFARFVAQSKKQGFVPTLGDYASALYQTLISQDHAVSRFVGALRDAKYEKTGRPSRLEFQSDPYVLYRRLPGAEQAAIAAVKDGVRAYNDPFGPIVSPSYTDAIKKALGGSLSKLMNEDDPTVKAFNAYLVSRRARAEWARWEAGDLRNQPVRASKNEVLNAIGQFETENPTFKEGADAVFAFMRANFQRQVDAGIVPKSLADAVLTRNSDYVPFWRDFEGEKAGGSGGKGGKSLEHSPYLSFGGSTRDIETPLRSVIESVAIGERMIARNEVWAHLHRIAQDAGEFAGPLLEQVPNSELKGASIDIAEAIRNNVRANGGSAQDAELAIRQLEQTIGEDMSATLYRPHETTPRGQRVAFYWRGGERVALKVGDGDMARKFFDVMTMATAPEKDVLVKAIGTVNTAFQASITHALRFMTGTLVRDNMTRMFIPRYMGVGGRVPFAQDIMGAYTLIADRAFAKAYGAGGGIRGGVYSHAVHELHAGDSLESIAADRNFASRTADEIRNAKGPLGVAKAVATTPLKMVTDTLKLIETSETVSRVGVAKMTYRYLLKQGLSHDEAMAGAMHESRDVLDYNRRGAGMYSAARIVPFLNAGIQGADRAMRGLVGEPIEAALKAYQRGGFANLDDAQKHAIYAAWKNWFWIGTAAGLTYAVYYPAVKDSKSYQNASEYMKQTYWIIPVGTDKDGNEKTLTIHKPYDLPSVMINVLESLANVQQSHDPRGWSRMMKSFEEMVPRQFHGFNDLLGSVPVVKTPFELATGVKLGFDDRPPAPIVPDKLKALPPEMQYDAMSSWISKKIGSIFGVSPKLVDHTINSMGGTLGQDMKDISSAVFDNNPLTSFGDTMNRFFYGQILRTQRGAPGINADLQHLMARDHGEYTRQANAYRQSLESGDRADAEELYNRADPMTQTLMTLNSSSRFKPEDRQLNPLSRSMAIASALYPMMRDLGRSQIPVLDRSAKKGVEKQEIKLNPDQARQLNVQFSQMLAEETRNGLAMAKQPGYEEYPIIDTSRRLDMIKEISPQAGAELEKRFKAGHILPAQGVAQVWPVAQKRLLQDRDHAQLRDLIAQAKSIH